MPKYLFNMNTHSFFFDIRASNNQIMPKKLFSIRVPDFSLIRMPNKHVFWEFVLKQNMAFVWKTNLGIRIFEKNIVAFVFRKRTNSAFV